MPQPPQRPGAPRIGAGPPSELETGKEKLATERLDDACKELEEELEEVKVKYDMFFLGVERMEPARRRDDLKRAIARLKNAFTRNAGLRFRIQSLHARYLSYERMWLRSAREKEEGTYRRDILRARMKAARRQARAGTAGAAKGPAAAPRVPGLESEDVDLDDLTADAASGAVAPLPVAPTPVAPTPTRPAASPGGAAPGLAEAQMRALFEAYLAAKKRCNEDTSKVTYEAVARSVAKQIPEIVRAYKAREVEFKVVIKDGKAILKAVPKV